jgi:phage shock protein PspC (stress-responsive transcriptional regulator)
MDKTININLGGALFAIDEEAYRVLKDYLQAIDLKFRNVPGGNETIEDIESRIAEIFLSQKGTAGVISLENIEAMILIIGKPEEFGLNENEGVSGSYSSRGSNQRKMFRNPDDTVIAGVCGGIGTYLGTDPVWIRILFVIFTFFFGFGFFIYLALWIAIPSADTETRRKDMYGHTYSHGASAPTAENRQYQTTSKIGNAINEVFKALGKVCYIFVRILLIIIGTCLVLTGFLALLTFVMVFVFKYPGSFSTDAIGFNIAYLPDFLDYVVTPASSPFIKTLIAMVISIPLLAIIYGGIRMIFWFRARDGFVWLTGFVLWVLSTAALSIVLFNEGIGFAEMETTTSEENFNIAQDTLFLVASKKVSDLKTDKEISIPDEKLRIFLSEDPKEIYTNVDLDIINDDTKTATVGIRKHSAGRSRFDAIENSERLVYNYSIKGDTLFLDEYFTIPAGTKWAFDCIGVTLKVPEGTVIHMDRTTETMFHSTDDEDFVRDAEESFWLMREDGLDYIGPLEKSDK